MTVRGKNLSRTRADCSVCLSLYIPHLGWVYLNIEIVSSFVCAVVLLVDMVVLEEVEMEV